MKNTHSLKHLRFAFGGLACAGAVCAAEVTNPQGLLEVSDISGIQSAIDATGSERLVLGNGMLKWTGGDATWPGGLVFNTQSNLEVTVNVTEPDATLRISGAATALQKAVFVKTGPGTVEFNGGGVLAWSSSDNHPWADGWWKTYVNPGEGNFLKSVTAWDEQTGVATNGGYTAFTVLDGTLRLQAPGGTFSLPVLPWVGGFTEAEARLEITNHTAVQSRGGWASVGRGTTTATSTVQPTIRVSDHSTFTVGALCMGNANGRAGYFCKSRIELDSDSAMSVGGDILHPEHSGTPVIAVTNRSQLTQTAGPKQNSGFKMEYESTTAAGNCSTIQVETASMGPNASLSVTGGSVFRYNRGIPSYYNASATRARSVHFDDATLAPYREGVLNEWFGNKGTGYNAFTVGALGLTLENTTDAWFGAQPRPAADGASLVKRGAGTLYLRPFTNMPVTLEEGALGYTNPYRNWTNALARSLAPAAGTRLVVAGEGALGGARIAPADDFTVAFRGKGRTAGSAATETALWSCNNWTRMLHDGTLQLTVGSTPSFGSAWRNEKIDVSSSFEIAFESYANCSASPAYGWMLAFQPANTTAYGNSEASFGYNFNSMTNNGLKSCAMGLNLETPGLLLGRMGTSIQSAAIGATTASLAAGPDAPLRNVFRYDAENKTATLTVRVTSTGQSFSRTESLDLAETLGATSVYMGFTGSTKGDRVCEHCIRNIRYTPDALKVARPGVVRTGGNLALGAGKKLTVDLEATEQVNVFAVDSLAVAGTAVLDLVDTGTHVNANGLPAPSLADHDAWTLSNNAYWRDDGSLANSQAKQDGYGGASSKAAYPVTGDWTIAFNWRLGAHSNGAADWFKFNLGPCTVLNASTTAGFTLFLRNWDGSKQPSPVSYLQFYTNNIEVAEARRIPMAEGFSLQRDDPVAFTLTYDDAAKTLTVTYRQGAAEDGFSIPFDAARCFRGADRARIGFWGQVGGSFNENVVSDFTWTGPQMTAALKPLAQRAAFAADALHGATAVVKSGSADLAFLQPAALDIPVTLAEGGLRFAKEPLATMDAGPCGGWIFNRDTGCYTASNGLHIGTNESNNRDNVQSRRRVRVGGRWRAHWTMSNTTGADALAFCIHNDPRGNQFTGDAWGAAGILGRYREEPDPRSTTRCCNVAWYTYTGDLQNKIGVGSTGTSFTHDVSPVRIRSATPIETTLVYDGDAKTLDVTLVQGANTFTHRYEDWDVVKMVGDDCAYLAFGTGGGGEHTYPNFDGFTFEQLDEVDTLATQRYVRAIDVSAKKGVFTLDSPVADGTFRVAETVTLPEDGTLVVAVADRRATLSAGTLTLGAGARLAGDEAATVAPDRIVGADEALSVDGVTLAVSAADETEKILAGTTLHLTGGAKIKANRSLRLRDVYVDGVKQTAPLYSATDCAWVAGGRVVLSEGTMLILR